MKNKSKFKFNSFKLNISIMAETCHIRFFMLNRIRLKRIRFSRKRSYTETTVLAALSQRKKTNSHQFNLNLKLYL